MKPNVLVTREIFDDVLEYLKQHFEVTSNQADTPMDAEMLAKKLAGKSGAMTTLVDKVDAQLLSRCPTLKAVCNIAVGFNNIDLAACSKAGVMATNTPGVLDDSTADFTWALILSTLTGFRNEHHASNPTARRQQPYDGVRNPLRAGFSACCHASKENSGRGGPPLKCGVLMRRHQCQLLTARLFSAGTFAETTTNPGLLTRRWSARWIS